MSRYMVRTPQLVRQVDTFDDLVDLAQRGALRREDKLRELPDGEWISAGDFESLQSAWSKADGGHFVVYKDDRTLFHARDETELRHMAALAEIEEDSTIVHTSSKQTWLARDHEALEGLWVELDERSRTDSTAIGAPSDLVPLAEEAPELTPPPHLPGERPSEIKRRSTDAPAPGRAQHKHEQRVVLKVRRRSRKALLFALAATGAALIALLIVLLVLIFAEKDEPASMSPPGVRTLTPVPRDAETWALLDQDGRSAFEVRSAIPVFLHEGRGAFAVDGRCGYVDDQGEVAITPQFDTCGTFQDAHAPVEVSGRWGLIDTHGRFVVNPQFEMAMPPSDGRALIAQNGLWGYVSLTGEVVVRTQYAEAGSFRGGLARVTRAGERWGYIDVAGNVRIPERYEAAGDLSEGLAAVRQEGQWGFVDPTGELVVRPQFDALGELREGLARACAGARCGYVDRAGRYVVNPQYDDASAFSDGLAAVELDGKWGFIDTQGTTVLSCQFTQVGRAFAGGVALVATGNEPVVWAWVRRDGTELWRDADAVFGSEMARLVEQGP